MRIKWVAIGIASICAGCGNDGPSDVNPGQPECAAENSVFTYPLPLPPDTPAIADFAVDDAFIYFTDAGTSQSSGTNDHGRILKMPVAGGDIVTLAMGEMQPHYIVVDTKNIYWTTPSAVRKMPISGGTPVTLSADFGWPQGLAVDEQFVYWTSSPAKLQRVSIDGGDVTQLVEESAASIAFGGIALDADDIFLTSLGPSGATNGGSVLKMPRAGGPVTTMATGQSEPSRIDADEKNIYWTNVGDFNTNVGLMKVSREGGSPMAVVSTQNDSYAQYAAVAGVYVDTRGLFWTSKGTQEYDHYDGAVLGIPFEGGAPTTFASAVHHAQESILVHGCHLYFTAAGNIHRIGLP